MRCEKDEDQDMRPYVKLYKASDQLGIETNCSNESEFNSHLASALAKAIESGQHDGDWQFPLERWLPAAFEIFAKIRGYKSNVVEHRILVAGHHPGWTDDALDAVSSPLLALMANGAETNGADSQGAEAVAGIGHE